MRYSLKKFQRDTESPSSENSRYQASLPASFLESRASSYMWGHPSPREHPGPVSSVSPPPKITPFLVSRKCCSGPTHKCPCALQQCPPTLKGNSPSKVSPGSQRGRRSCPVTGTGHHPSGSWTSMLGSHCMVWTAFK